MRYWFLLIACIAMVTGALWLQKSSQSLKSDAVNTLYTQPQFSDGLVVRLQGDEIIGAQLDGAQLDGSEFRNSDIQNSELLIGESPDNHTINLVTNLTTEESDKLADQLDDDLVNELRVSESPTAQLEQLAEQETGQAPTELLLPQAQPSEVPLDIVVDSEELRSLLKIDINFMIERWRQSWQSGDSATYLSLYSAEFTPADTLSYQQWQDQRKRLVTPGKKIRVELSNFEVILDAGNQNAVVSFDQEYRSKSFNDKSRKQLTLVKKNQWLIVSELTL